MADVTITPRDNASYMVRGPVKLVDAEGNEFTLEGDTIFLCRCGGSNKPFCGGTLRRSARAVNRARQRPHHSDEEGRPGSWIRPVISHLQQGSMLRAYGSMGVVLSTAASLQYPWSTAAASCEAMPVTAPAPARRRRSWHGVRRAEPLGGEPIPGPGAAPPAMLKNAMPVPGRHRPG
jgi:CDGSH-type Zn-finger protein